MVRFRNTVYGLLISSVILMADAADSTHRAISPQSRLLFIDSLLRSLPENDHRSAIPLCREAIVLAEQVNDLPRTAALCMRAGALYEQVYRNDSARHFTEHAVRLYTSLGDKKNRTEALYLLGNIRFNLGELNEALEVYRKARQGYIENGDTEMNFELIESIGNVHRMLGQYEMAVELYKEGMELADELGTGAHKAGLLTALGYINRDMQNVSEALENFKRSLAIYTELGDTLKIIEGNNDVARMLLSIQRIPEALRANQEAVRMSEAFGDKSLLSLSLDFMGATYAQLRQYDTAIGHYLRSLELKMELKERFSIPYSYAHIGDIYQLQGRFRDAIGYYERAVQFDSAALTKYARFEFSYKLGMSYAGLKEYRRSNEYLVQSLASSLSMNTVTQTVIALRQLSLNHSALEEYKQAYGYSRRAMDLKDSLFTAESQRGSATVLSRLENENKEKHIQLLLKEQQLQTTYLFAAVIGFVLLSFFTLTVFVFYRQKQRTSELLRLRTDRLAELNKMKDRFFSIVAHDLKSPFTTLLGVTEIVTQDGESMGKEDLISYNQMMRREVLKVYSLIEDLLEWGRVQRDTATFHPKRHNLSEDVTDAIVFLSSSREKKGIQLTASLPDEVALTYDQGMIRSVIRNLLTNALKFTGTGGTISIGLSSTAQHAVLTIADTGVGISADDMSKLFRIDHYHTTRGTDDEPGTGLGLILCKEMVDMHGGSITVDSTVGKGTTFTILLPLDSVPVRE